MEVRHAPTNRIYAMKIIRAVERFVDTALVTFVKKIEGAICEKIKEHPNIL